MDFIIYITAGLVLLLNNYFDFLSKDITKVIAFIAIYGFLRWIIKDSVKEAIEESKINH